MNAYHQPGVEAGKIAAKSFIMLIGRVRSQLDSTAGEPQSAAEVASAIESELVEEIYHVLNHLAATSPSYSCVRGESADADQFERIPEGT